MSHTEKPSPLHPLNDFTRPPVDSDCKDPESIAAYYRAYAADREYEYNRLKYGDSRDLRDKRFDEMHGLKPESSKHTWRERADGTTVIIAAVALGTAALAYVGIKNAYKKAKKKLQ